MKDADILLNEAINNKQFINFLRGTQQYAITKSEFIPSAIPTDTAEVLRACFSYYEKNNSIREILQETLIMLINGKGYDLYIATLYILDFYLMKERDFVTFQIDLEQMLKNLKCALISNKEELNYGIEYPNAIYYENAWNDIVRWSNTLKNKYNVELVN
jgi:hypothetical protein